MAETPKYTTRLNIPYPPERGEDWWTIEDAAGGRMDRLDLCIYAAMENQVLFWQMYEGSWRYNNGTEVFEVWYSNVRVRSPAGGIITFTNGYSIPVADGDFVYFEVPERPLTGTGHTGVFGTSSTFTERPDRVVLGRRYGSSFVWLRPLLITQPPPS